MSLRISTSPFNTASIVLGLLFISMLVAIPVQAATLDDSFDDVYYIGVNNKAPVDPSIPQLILSITLSALQAVAILALLAIVIASINYIMSFGDEQKAARAKAGLLAAIIGTILAGGAWLIIRTIGQLFWPTL